MEIFLTAILDILKFTIPSLVVYFLMDRFLHLYLVQQKQQSKSEGHSKAQETALPLRLQAYERLALLCERTDLPNLLLRIQPENMMVREYQIVLLLALQKEYEHNITQQIYVSNTLWNIVRVAREDTVELIQYAAGQLAPTDPGKKLADTILLYHQQRGTSAQSKALEAIRQEAFVLFG